MTYSNVNRIAPEYARLMKKGRLQTGDTLINKDGAQTGKVAQYAGEFERAWVNEHVFILRPILDEIHPDFLFYSMLDGIAQQQISRRITGSAQPGLNSDFIRAVTLAIPNDLKAQSLIARVLKLLDTQIEATEALIAKQERLRAGLMQDLFTRGVDENGELRPPREEAPHLYHETEIGWLPTDWRTGQLRDLTTKIVDGVHHTPTYVEQGIPFVTVKSLTAGRGIATDRGNYISLSDHRIFLRRADPRLGDVLVSKDGTLGIARLVEKDTVEFSIFVSVALLRPIPSSLSPSFLREFFNTHFYHKQMGYLSAGSGLKHIHLEHFRKFILPLPETQEQGQIIGQLGEIDCQILHTEKQLEKLRLQKSGLMQDLLTGTVSVEPLLEKEPA